MNHFSVNYNYIYIADYEDSAKEKVFSSNFELFLDYTEFSTIQGLIYIFISHQTIIGRIFWSVVIILMLMLGIYWCREAYNNWVNQPVLTTVTTTAYPANRVIAYFEFIWAHSSNT